MFRFGWTIRLLLILAVLSVMTSHAHAQSRDRYALKAAARAAGEEIAGQPRLWVMDVEFKPMRFLDVPIKDPKSGETKTERIWYLVYRAINRTLPQREGLGDVVPLNDDDPEPRPPLFVPEFTLQTDDTTDNRKVSEVFPDVLVPEAESFINQREKRVYKNTVDVIQPVPEPVAVGEDAGENAIYGVAMWRGVPKETDYFTVYMEGFSNGYRYVKGPVPFDKLQELAKNGELKAGNSVWDGAGDLKTASEYCGWEVSGKRLFDQNREWTLAGNVSGLLSDLGAPAPGAEEKVWFYTQTPDQFAGQPKPPVWRRTLRQHFTRYGDQFDEREREFRACGEPTWIYRAETPRKSAPEANP